MSLCLRYDVSVFCLSSPHHLGWVQLQRRHVRLWTVSVLPRLYPWSWDGFNDRPQCVAVDRAEKQGCACRAWEVGWPQDHWSGDSRCSMQHRSWRQAPSKFQTGLCWPKAHAPLFAERLCDNPCPQQFDQRGAAQRDGWHHWRAGPLFRSHQRSQAIISAWPWGPKAPRRPEAEAL